MYILKIFESFIKNYKFTLIIYILCTMMAFPLESIVVPQIYSHFFEILSTKTEISVFIKYLILIVVLLAVVNIANCSTTYIESYMIPELNGYIINYIFKNLLKKYENSITEIELGKIITRINVIPTYFKDIVTEFCIWIFPRALAIIIINIYFFYLNWKLGFVSIILLIIFFSVNLHLFTSCISTSNERYALFEKKNQYTQDKLSNSHSIYSAGSLNKEISNYELNTNGFISKFKDNLSCLSKATIFTSILIVIVFVGLNSMATYLFIKKELSFTNLMAIFITIIYYIPCIVTINSTMPNLINCYGALESLDDFVEDLYNINVKNINKVEEPSIKIIRGNIVINNLNFGYNTKSNDTELSHADLIDSEGQYIMKESTRNNLFQNFYLTIKENEKIAIVGPSGNGKSTLIKLIMGYYKINNNMVFIDGIDINKFNLNDLRKQISYVNQNSKLFNMSLLENIQYGNNFTRKEIEDLCKKIHLDNVFKNLKNGLDTQVGIDGNNLSGGQKQLVHILRCICKKNKIIILDEPTSAIDKENTGNVVNAIKELSKNNTLILITHDESILSIVDRVVTLDSGKIVNDKYAKQRDMGDARDTRDANHTLLD